MSGHYPFGEPARNSLPVFRLRIDEAKAGLVAEMALSKLLKGRSMAGRDGEQVLRVSWRAVLELERRA